MDLVARVRRFIREHDLVQPGARVVAAVSGGGDSMALVRVLAELDRGGDARLAGIAHFNHQLRATADRDEAFVSEAARALDVPLVADREAVAARAAREGRSIEDAGRAARYAFFERARVELAADVVALGHTRDDQAETFLLRLLRGAGPRGLAGMHPRHGTIVRPLLDCRRDELRAWLDARGVAHTEDETNADVRVPRNRVRAELIPLLAERFNPSVVDVLADEAALAQETWQWMDEASAPFLATDQLDVAELNRLPAALRRVIVWRVLSTHAGGRHVSFNHVRDVIRLMQATEGSLDLPGQQVQRIGTRIVIVTGRGSRGSTSSRGSQGSTGSRGSQGSTGSRRSTNANLQDPENLQSPENPENLSNPENRENLPNRENLYCYPLSIPGEVAVPESGCVVSVGPATGDVVAERRATVGNGPIAVVRRDRLTESLVVRNRRPGDRFQPVGLPGRKKLQDLFVDKKVARADRDVVPLVVDARGRIVWVAGFGIDEAFRVTDAAQAVLLLRLTRA